MTVKTTIRVTPLTPGKIHSGEPATITVIRHDVVTPQGQHHPEWDALMRRPPESKGTGWHSRGKQHWEWETG